MSIATSIRNNSLTAVIRNKVYNIASDHPNYKKVIDAITAQNEELAIKLMDIPSAIRAYFREGNVTVNNGEVLYRNKAVGGVVVDRIIAFIQQGLPVKPMLRFIDKLMSNPSYRAITELYSFLEHKNLPINENGNFLAYKGLRGDFWSCTCGKLTLVKGKVDSDGRIYNGVGEEIECLRNEVDDNKENHCSKGIHAGSMEYATGFSQGKTVIVEINPKDVVSIPSDCECQKLRTCAYKVIGEYEQPLDSNFSPSEDWDEDENEFDEDSEDTDSGSCCEDTDETAESALTADDDYQNGYDDGEADYNNQISNEYLVFRKKSKRSRSDYQRGYCDGYTDAREK